MSKKMWPNNDGLKRDEVPFGRWPDGNGMEKTTEEISGGIGEGVSAFGNGILHIAI